MALLVLLGLIAASSTGAVTDSELLTTFGSAGSAAGQLRFSEVLAADPVTGHVYVGGFGSNRVDEFTPWGGFVKAFGWGVAPGGVDEQQEVRVRASAGTFRLSFGASTTADLPLDASAAEVQSALDGLASIGGVGGSVSVSVLRGSVVTSSPYVFLVVFKGSLGASDVAQLGAVNGVVPLSGGEPATGLEVRTRADGAPGGAGLEDCTSESGCQAGLVGSGAGEIEDVFGLAVDPAGDVYVRENNGNPSNLSNRVQEFSSSGRFVLMFGGGVDKTEVHERKEQEAHGEPVTVTAAQEDRCTAVSGDECGAGVSGTGQGQFSGLGLGIALGPGGSVFVADVGRIQRFSPAGEFEAELKLPGETVRGLAADPKTGVLYADYLSGEINPPTKENVRELSPVTGAEIGQLKVRKPEALAVDPAGDVYVLDKEVGESEGGEPHPDRVLEFSSGGGQIASLGSPPQGLGLRGLGTGPAGDLYVSAVGDVASDVRVFGVPPLAFEPPPVLAPSIVAQYASAVGDDNAVVRAQINPHFWPDATYSVQYGTAECVESGWTTGCQQAPLTPAALDSNAINFPFTTAGVLLSGLSPGTAYHYRFIAQSGGGGPVRGVGGTEQTDGSDRVFTTFGSSTPVETDCSNQAFRTGLSAYLGDCRAYEMVSPVDKNSGDILVLGNINGNPTGLDQSAVSGDRLVYASYRAFGDAQAGPYTSQYIATRHEGEGWSSHAISPPRGIGLLGPVETLETEFWGFSEDLCSGWLRHDADPPLAAGAPEGYPGLYRRQDCGAEGYEALTTIKPPNLEFFVPEVQGFSADGSRAFFRVKDQLTSDANPIKKGLPHPSEDGTNYQCYESFAGELHLVSVLPSGVASKEDCSLGTAGENHDDGRSASLHNAVSSDGSRVFWTAESGVGKLYLRVHPEQPQSAIGGGQCTEAELACTIAVSAPASALPDRFWGASTDGSRAIFTAGETRVGAGQGDLYEARIEAEGEHLVSHTFPIAHQVFGLLGVSDDASRMYFVSKEALGVANAQGKSAVVGQPNLYLYEAGEAGAGRYVFVATLSATDARDERFMHSPVNSMPLRHTARVSRDGRQVAFTSTMSLTGYDNIDRSSGEEDGEVYVYDATAGESGVGRLFCASCNPTGARPVGRKIDTGTNRKFPHWAAGSLPVALTQLSAPRYLSADGKRLFFESFDALLARDTNGKADVYEWEAPGEGRCEEGSASYSPANGGCLYLISSGESPSDSELIDASADGSDVFFTTGASLLPQDPGLIDVYDARVDGGFPAPPPAPVACEGEACQNPPAPPLDVTPGSVTFSGNGNLLLSTPPVQAKPKPRAGVSPRARKLARALSACNKKPRRQRAGCIKKARRQYGTSAKKANSTTRVMNGGRGLR